MRSAERLDEEKQMCDGCRTNRALGIMKPPSCIQCGKEVSSYYREDREEHLKAFIAYRKNLLPNEEKQKQIEAELDAEIAREEKQNVGQKG